MEQLQGCTRYDSIRRYLEQIYLYGFLSREDWAAVGTVKDYDKMLTLLREMYPELENDAIWEDRRKYLRFQRSYVGRTENRLVNTYMLHSMDEEELCVLLRILSLLSAKPQTIQTAALGMEMCTDEETDWYHTVRRRLKELESYGYVMSAKMTLHQQKGQFYSLQEDILKQLDSEELEELYDYVRFASGVTCPRVAGSYLKRTVARHLLRKESKSPVLLRHHNKRSIFDEDALYVILTVIQNGNHIRVQRSSGEDEELLPVSVRFDVRLGRWYLLAMGKAPEMHRISALKKVSELKKPTEEKEKAAARKTVSDAFRYALFSGDTSRSESVVVEAELCFEGAPGMYEQFQRELRVGEIVERNGIEYYHAEVNDALSLAPLLRAFSPWLRICPGEHGLAEKIRDDLQLMRAALEKE